jgi:hypothetical protein
MRAKKGSGKTDRVRNSIITTDSIPAGNFVAAVVSLDTSGVPEHAGILVKYEGDVKLLHLGRRMEFRSLKEGERYIGRRFVSIDSEEVSSFVVHANEANDYAESPKWGYWYNGSYFEDGKAMFDEKKPFYTTCVGFCLAMLTGFIKEHYLEYTDWTADDTSLPYFEKFYNRTRLTYPDLTREEFANDYRRIRPDEYLASSFIAPSPIRKTQTDTVLGHLTPVIKEVFDSHNSRRPPVVTTFSAS